MHDPEFDAGPVDKRLDPSRPIKFPGRRRIIIACLAFVGACWLGLAGYSSRRYTCVLCREDMVESRFLGLSRSEPTETDCSRWYRDNVERSHAHVWARYGSCRPIGFLGVGGVACSIGPPITMLSTTAQIELYQHFEDRQEARRVFQRLGSSVEGNGNLFEALTIWRGRNCLGTWRDWWARYRAEFE